MSALVSADDSGDLWRARLLLWRFAVARRVAALLRPIYRTRAEILLVLAMLSGWAGVTWGVALLTTPKVWPLSAGLLLLSCVGWRLLWTIATYGLYGLTRARDG